MDNKVQSLIQAGKASIDVFFKCVMYIVHVL